MPNTMASIREKLTEADWLPHKHHITSMIHSQKCSNSDILKWLWDHDFKASKSQLEYQLKNWNIRRKLRKGQSEAIWRYVGHRISKRRNQGKDSRVVIEGKVYDALEVAKEVSRNQQSTLERIRQGPASPRSPEGMIISVCSPDPLESESSWPSNLPWFKFQLELPISISPKSMILTQSTNDLLHLLTRHLITRDMQDITHRNDHHSLPAMSHLVSGLRHFMPEAYPDEFLTRAQSIMQGLDNQRLEQLIMIIIFRLSNNLHMNDLIKIWPTVLNLFQISGIMSKPLKSKETTDITAMAVAEKLYRIAFQAGFHPNLRQPRDVRERTRTLIKWLLSSGQDPNEIVSIGSDTSDTSLHAAILYQELDLAMILLSKGADPNFMYGRYFFKQRMPLLVAVDSDDYAERLNMIEALLRNNANPNILSARTELYPLGAAVYRKDFLVVELLTRYGAKVDHEWKYYFPFKHEPLNWIKPEASAEAFTDIHTILGCAAGISPEPDAYLMVHYLLGQLQKQGQSIDTTWSILVETLLIAAGRGYDSVLILLLDQGIDVNATNSRGYTALSLAAFWGHLSSCRLLLERGASIEPFSQWNPTTLSPLHLAVYGDHLDVVELLHKSGANIRREVNSYRRWDNEPFWIYNKFYAASSSNFMGTSMNMNTLMSRLCATPVGAAMYNTKTGSTYRYLVSNGARIPLWMAHHAARYRKDFKLLLFLLDNGQDPNEQGPDNVTLLECVLFQDDVTNEIVKFSCGKMAAVLLDRGYKPTKSEAVLAVMLGNWELAERILCQDGYPYVNDIYYQKAMFRKQSFPNKCSMIRAACLSRNTAIIQKILDLDPNVYDGSALCLATLLVCESGDDKAMDIIDQLLKRLPQESMSTEEETLALGIASWYENMQLLELFLGKITPSQTIKISQARNDSIVFDPTIWCSLEPIGIKEASSYIEISPLIFTLESPQARALLLSRGCKADVKVLRLAIETGDLALMKELLSGNRQPLGGGILSKAIGVGNMEMVETLLESGEDINAECCFGDNYENAFHEAVEEHDNPLQTAIGGGNSSIWNLLLSKNPDVNIAPGPVYQGTALQIACKKGYLGLAKRLIDLGANIDTYWPEWNVSSALEHAAENGRIDMIQLLLSSGALTTGQWRQDHIKAIAIAKENRHWAAVEVLRLHRE